MKAFLFILSAGVVLHATGQAPDTFKHLPNTVPDSVTTAFPVLTSRYAFVFNSFTPAKIVALPGTSDRKVQLYWDPVYLKLVPFKVQSNYKEGWLSGAATIAAQALFPLRKIER